MNTMDGADSSAPPTVTQVPLTIGERFDTILEECGEITLLRFKKEAMKAWKRKYNEPPMREFQKFVQSNIKSVREANITEPHATHMKIIGQMWHSSKRSRV